jgi:2-polyprenyl-6-methoxyphenol hydroxylase-like FAD-dependent oxidoreductase
MDEIAVIGGGIGGLCTAIALRNRGYQPQVYEQTAEFRPVGSGIWIPPNGMAALDRLGTADTIEDAGVSLDGTEIESNAGTTLMSADLTAHAQELGIGRALTSIRRPTLQEELLSCLPSESVHLDMECVEIDSTGPTVAFADGTSISPTLVIGADGVRSAVRSSLFPDVSIRFAGAVTYRGLVNQSLPTQAYRVGTAIWGDGGRFGYSAVEQDCAWWFFAIPGRSADDVPNMDQSDLTSRCQSFPEPAAEFVSNTPPEALIRTPLGDLPSLERWHENRVTLLGDAAHAMTPNLAQGSAQAMEDAVVLAEEITRHGPTEQALVEYESRRKPRADHIRKQSRIQGWLGQINNQALTMLRNTVIRYSPSTLFDRQTRQMLAVDF